MTAITAEICEKQNRLFGYAGDVSAAYAWEILGQDANAVLVDVRTPQEWEQIGLPVLTEIGKDVLCVTWNMSAPAEANSQFVSAFSQQQVAHDTPVLLLCRSGGRSQAAACALTAAGYTRCFNIAEGFEGSRGWKNSGLPTNR